MTLRIATSEGASRLYEVLESVEGFLVRAMDAATGSVVEDRVKLFRTAPAAFAFAELSATRDRLSCARSRDGEGEAELRACAERYETIVRALGDDGVPGHLLGAWSEAEEAAARRHYH
ncbi:MAG: hypothetical protein U1E62_12155 [Alsobacter sp.]